MSAPASDQNPSMCTKPSEINVLDSTYQIRISEPFEVKPEPRGVENYLKGFNGGNKDALTASIHPGKLNFKETLRTVHQEFELPDSHPLLEEFEERVTDDPCPYLLAIWPTGVISKLFQQHSSGGDLVEPEMCNEINIHPSCKTNEGETVKGTILIPWRTATRGTFPVKGSCFQANEVFADHESSEHPIDVPKAWICNLPKRSLHCGMTATTIFGGATSDKIQDCFSRGSICSRGFHKKQREVRRLNARFHISPCAAGDIGGATL